MNVKRTIQKGYLLKKSATWIGREQIRFFELFSDGQLKYSQVLKNG